MRTLASELIPALAIAALAALGGAAVVLAGIDDSPGGQLIGLLMIVGAVALGVRAARRRS